RSTGDHRQQIVPATPHSAAVTFDQLAEADAHRFLDYAGGVNVARQLEKLGALILLTADAREPFGAAAEDCGDDGDGFDVVDRGRAAREARACRERRLQARLALLAL